jgi:hypothetical protein
MKTSDFMALQCANNQLPIPNNARLPLDPESPHGYWLLKNRAAFADSGLVKPALVAPHPCVDWRGDLVLRSWVSWRCSALITNNQSLITTRAFMALQCAKAPLLRAGEGHDPQAGGEGNHGVTVRESPSPAGGRGARPIGRG